LPVIGLTATPEGVDGIEEVLGRPLHVAEFDGRNPILALADQGVLACPARTLVSYAADGNEVPLGEVEDAEGVERPTCGWGRVLAGNASRRNEIVDAITKHLAKLQDAGRVLVFASCIPDVHALKWECEKRGVPAAIATGRVQGTARAAVLRRFRTGQVRVLVNYGVLATGYDEPGITAVVIARPTGSDILYSQMVGRGLRGEEFGGTKECQVLDVEDSVVDTEGKQVELARDRFWRRLGSQS
jgi:superfamily II DNA or RNA helicase